MSELIPNGTTYPALPQQEQVIQAVQHLDLREMLLERGTSGLKRPGGFIREEMLRELSGLQAVRTYTEMRNNSPVVGACLYALEMLVRNVQWHFRPANDSAEAQHYADLADGMLFQDLDLPWSLLISEILSFLPYGYSFFELVFKRRLGLDPPPLADGTPGFPSQFDDGYIGLARIAPRAHETVYRWQFDHTGGLLGMHQIDPYAGHQAYIPLEKSLLFRPTSYKNNPEGRSVLRTAYRSYYLITHIENTEAIGIERDLAGLPVFGTPPQWWLASASPEEQAQLELVRRLGRNIRQDEQACLVYPLIYDQAGNQLFKFELASSGGSKAINSDTTIQRHELRITQSLLCDAIFLGHEDVGSFALASSKTTTQAMSLGGYLTAIKDELQQRLLPLLWRLNAFPKPLLPELCHSDVETVDLSELARFMLSFGRLYNATDLENKFRNLAGLPERAGAETNPLPPSIQPSGGGASQGEGLGSHGGGSGTGTTGSPREVGLPDLDRALSSQSLSLSMDPARGRVKKGRRRGAPVA